jgi:predicted kinase
MQQKIILARGLPASGKSTYAENWAAENPDERVRVNRDELRMQLFGYWYHPNTIPHGKQQEREHEVTHHQTNIIVRGLSEGKNVIVDNTNLNPRVFRDFEKLLKQFPDVEFAHIDFNTPLSECIRRNSQRERKVPEHVIRSMAARYTNGDGTKFHLFPGVYPTKPITLPNERKNAIGFDMDGTLANVDSILHYVRKESRYKDFDSFHRSSYFSPPNQNVVEILFEAVNKGFTIVIVTGRNEKYRDVTQAWLDGNDIPYENIFMRPADDFRPDTVIKNEIFQNINQYYHMVHFVDDRTDVAKVWEGNGVQTSIITPETDDLSALPRKWNVPNPFATGKCLKCGRTLQNPNSVLGPECAKQ